MKNILLFIIIFTLIVPTASAFTFINIYVDETGEAIFLGETDENPILPNNIELKNTEITGITQELTSKNGEIWTFSYFLPNSELNIILPKGAVIKDFSKGEVFLTEERISIYALNEIEISYIVEKTPSTIPSTNIPLIILFIAIIIVLIVFLVNYSKRETEKPKTESEKSKIDIKHLLNEREKLILEKLKQTGKIKSSQLRKLTEIPKASFSRHIQELEKKKLIKRSGEGRNKFVEMIDN